MLFDLQNIDSAKDFICYVTKVSKDSLLVFESSISSDAINEFLEYHKETIMSYDISDDTIRLIHHTSNHDECESIRKLGLVNLQQSLAQETPLRKFLYEQGIEIIMPDTDSMSSMYTLVFDGNSISFSIDDGNNNLRSIAARLNVDLGIWAFLYLDSISTYDICNIKDSPLILQNLEAYSRRSLKFQWCNLNNKAYNLICEVPVDWLKEDINSLISAALWRINGASAKETQIKDNQVVPAKSIVEYVPTTVKK